MSKYRLGLSVVLLSFFAVQSFSVETVEERDARMEWWREARFGMFVHWGLYSIPAGKWGDYERKRGGVEWIQKLANVPADEYGEILVPQFKPKKDFAKEWAGLAKTAGCKYLVFTSKHHEGFAMHDSRVSDFDAKDACGRDLFKEIVDATRAEGLKVGVYHSVIDWHHPDAYAGFGLPTIKGTTNEGRDNSSYVDYLHEQVREFATGYGPIDIVWWDYSSKDCQGESWRADELLIMLRKHQPRIISNNRLYRSAAAGWPKDWKNGFSIDPKYGDFCTPEQHIPPTGVQGVDWETCMTMNTTWGYSQFDHEWKSSEKLIQNLVDVVSKGGNYLLNIGPKADGSVPQESIDRMNGIGEWMNSYGDSIYGTTASKFEKLKWGRSTTKTESNGATRLYLHVFDWPEDGILTVPGLAMLPETAELLTPSSVKKINVAKKESNLLLELPDSAIDPNVSVIVLIFKTAPKITNS